MSFNLRYMMVSYVKRFWSYEGRKDGHSALAELSRIQEYTRGPSVFSEIFKKCNCWRVFAIWPNCAQARACAYTAIGMIIQLLSDDRHSKWAVKRTQIGFTINLASARAQILKLLLLGQQTTQSLYFSMNLTNSPDSDLSLESKRYGIKECVTRGV